MGQISDFKDLDVWRVAMQLVTLTYRATRKLPDDERFGLISQMRRTSVSIASNIAEGYGRGSRQDYLRFLLIARGAACELETQALLCIELEYEVSVDELLSLLRRWYQLMNRLVYALQHP